MFYELITNVIRNTYKEGGKDMENTMELLKLLWPIIALQIVMQVFCLVKLFKSGSRNLNKLWWTIIIIILSILGPVVFLLFGLNRGDSHDFS